ncbi:DUF6129 family protein [uncultured Thiodictyon sp.]|uniref:DUF6129 family protein n=1 Tax=uncultured Thiodictyon sp. TaxID=1846217 RepID=UPI0025E25388|nr:DUF6129 family protein [uncultured Thiodictyon sp.]
MISAERLDQVVQVVARAGLNEQTVGALREVFAPIHFTYCQDEDIGEGVGVTAPVRSSDGFNLYLVDGQAHCLRLTADADAATGLVLAALDHGAH